MGCSSVEQYLETVEEHKCQFFNRAFEFECTTATCTMYVYNVARNYKFRPTMYIHMYKVSLANCKIKLLCTGELRQTWENSKIAIYTQVHLCSCFQY